MADLHMTESEAVRIARTFMFNEGHLRLFIDTDGTGQAVGGPPGLADAYNVLAAMHDKVAKV